jgi:hypothetical protein
MFTPRTPAQILQDLAARAVTYAGATDIAEGSALLQLLATLADEIALKELDLAQIRDSFFLDGVNGADLDRRCAELPAGGVVRRGPTTASGGAGRLIRDGISGDLVIPAGSLVLVRTDGSPVLYRNADEVTIPDGSATLDNVRLVAQTPGSAGNAIPAILGLVQGPASVLSASNMAALTTGADREPDADLRVRARSYLGSLARCQPSAIEYAARSFVASDGSRALFAAVVEDVRSPGYSEVVIDDGSGGAGGRRAGILSSGTIPTGSGSPFLWYEAPAVAAPTITITRGGSPFDLVPGTNCTPIPERGLMVVDDGVLEAGDLWAVGAYEVYTGLVSELQVHIDGSASAAGRLPGWRAAGTRVRVRPALREDVGFDLWILPRAGVDLAALSDRLRRVAVGVLQSLAPGAPLYVGQLVAALMSDPDLQNVRVYQSGTSDPLPDLEPASRDRSLRTSADRIGVVPNLSS